MTLKGSMLIYDYGTSSNALNEVFNKFVGELITIRGQTIDTQAAS